MPKSINPLAALMQRWRENLLDYGCRSQLHNLETSQSLEVSIWLCFLAILSMSMVSSPDLQSSTRIWIVQRMTFMMATGFTITIGLLIWLIVVISSDRLRKNGKVMKVCIYMTIAFTYIVYPLMVRFGAENVALKDTKTIGRVLGSLTLILGIFPSLCGTRLLRCQFPTNSLFLSCSSRLTESVCYWSELLLIAATTFAEARLSRPMSATFGLLLSLTMALLIILGTWKYRVYWNDTANILFATGFFVANILKVQVSFGRLDYFQNQNFMYSSWFVFCAVYGKVMTNRTHSQAFVNLCSSKTSEVDFKQAIYYFEQAWVKLNAGCHSKNTRKVYAYYYGSFLQGVYGKSKDMNEQELDLAEREMIMLNRRFHFELLQYILEEKKMKESIVMLDVILFLMLNQTMQSLNYCFILLREYKRKVAGFFFGELDYSFLRLAFEVKLKAIYKGKIKDDDKHISLRDSLQSILLASRSDLEENYLDIYLPIRAAHQYQSFCSKVLEMLDTKKQLFTELSSSKRMTYSSAFAKNEKIKQLSLAIDDCIAEFEEKIKRRHMFIGYFYGGILLYIKCVRYDLRRVKSVFQHYRLKRQLLMAYNTNGLITEQNLFKEGVVLECSVQKDSLGIIRDHTVDCHLHLGLPKEGSTIIGSNINSLMLESLQNPHFELMLRSYRFLPLNAQREFYILGFDGELYEVRFLVKLVPQVSDCLKCLVYLRKIVTQSRSLMIVDKTMNIVGCYLKLQDILNRSSNGTSVKSLKQLSTSLCSCIDLLRSYKQLEAKYPKNIPVPEWSFAGEITAVFEQIESMNKLQGLAFDIDKSGPCSEVLDGFMLTAHVELSSFKRTQLAKVYLKLKTTDNRHLNSVTGQQGARLWHQTQEGTSQFNMSAESSRQMPDFLDGERDDTKDRLKIEFYIRKLYEIVDRYKLGDSLNVAALDTGDKTLQTFIDCLHKFPRETKLSHQEYFENNHRGSAKLMPIPSNMIIKESTKEEEQSPVHNADSRILPNEQKVVHIEVTSVTEYIQKRREGKRKSTVKPLDQIAKLREELFDLINGSALGKTFHHGSRNSLDLTVGKDLRLLGFDSSRRMVSGRASEDNDESSASHLGPSKKNQLMNVVARKPCRLHTQSKVPNRDQKGTKKKTVYQKLKDRVNLLSSANLINRLVNSAAVN